MMALGCKYIFDLATSYELSTQTKTSLVLDIKASATHAESEAKYLDHIATCDVSIPVIMFVENLTPELKALINERCLDTFNYRLKHIETDEDMRRTRKASLNSRFDCFLLDPDYSRGTNLKLQED